MAHVEVDTDFRTYIQVIQKGIKATVKAATLHEYRNQWGEYTSN